MEDMTMNTVSRILFAISISSVSSAVYAQSAAPDATKSAAPAAEHVKHKAVTEKHKAAVPSETGLGDAKSTESHGTATKPAPLTAAPKVAKPEADKSPVAKPAVTAKEHTKPAKAAKSALKPEAAVDAPKPVK
jgi:hypothetical protein